MAALQKRRRALVAEFQDSRVESIERESFDLIRGNARFEDEKTLRVTMLEGGEEEELSFKTAIVATGSSAVVPPIEGLTDVPFMTSKESLELEELPEHLVILGGGVVGCEAAHCFEGLGSEVTILQRGSRLLKNLSPRVGEELLSASRRRGITVHLSAEATSVSRSASGIEITALVDGKEEVICGSHLLVAVGRKPTIESLVLDKAGVGAARGGIEINDFCVTSQEHIFAVGDCSQGNKVVHLAVLEGLQAAENAAAFLEEGQGSPVDSTPNLIAIFTEPEVIQIGPTAAKLEEQGDEFVTLTYPLNDMGKGIIKGLEEGYVSFTKEKLTGRLVAATAVGSGVIDFSHSMVVAIRRGLTQEQFYNVPHYHPTMAEAWTYPEEKGSES
jgi:mercuric reductase